MTDQPKCRPHTSRSGDGWHEVGIAVRCDRCSETITGIICREDTYEATMAAAQDMADVEARDRGWRVEPNGARCRRCKTPPDRGA